MSTSHEHPSNYVFKSGDKVKAFCSLTKRIEEGTIRQTEPRWRSPKVDFGGFEEANGRITYCSTDMPYDEITLVEQNIQEPGDFRNPKDWLSADAQRQTHASYYDDF